jgi:hypothetical protein
MTKYILVLFSLACLGLTN